MRWGGHWGLALAVLVAIGGCAGKQAMLVKLANQGRWEELDREARAMKRAPQGKSARAWARALVELGDVEQARAVLLRDFRTGGQEASLLELAALEASLGLAGMSTAHFARLYAIDDQDLRASDHASTACEAFRRRAHALAQLGEPLAADGDLRRLAGICPSEVTKADRELLAAIEPDAEQQARAQRTLIESESARSGRDADEPLNSNAESAGAAELRLAEQLQQARKRSPRAVLALADAEQIQLEPDDVALLLAAEFAGALGPGLVSPRRLSGWVGDNDIAELVDAISTLPDGVREYAFLRLASVRHSDRLGDDREAWIVAAIDSLDGRGPRETAKAWRVAASTGDLASAEFILNTNLRDLSVKPVEPGPSTPGMAPSPTPIGLATPWWLRVPVDRQTFDLLLSLARLFELRAEHQHDVLALRRRVIAAGYEAGLAQVAEVAIEEVRRQLVLGHPWQALALAEVVPGPLVEELLPTVASALGLRAALRADADGDTDSEIDRQVVARTLGDDWVATWQTRIAAVGQVPPLAAEQPRCPSLASWLDPAAADSLAAVGLDPEASRTALELALVDLDGPELGPALTRALEADVALACTGPVVIPLLAAGLHELTLTTLDERLVHVPELEAALQHQLHAELALGHGQLDRAALLTASAAAISPEPREMWARAAIAGRDHGAREYMLEALRQVLLHSPGLRDEAARRELLLTRLRDVDRDAILRDTETDPESSARATTIDELNRALADWLFEAPIQRRWGLLDGLIVQLASESRADALAWSLLADLLLDPDTRARHPAAAEAFDRAATASPDRAEPPTSKLASPRELAFLSDSAALCELAQTDANAETTIGVATACDPRSRAQALADLLTNATPEQRERLQPRVLAGPHAVEIDPTRPGSLLTVPALAREGLLLRVLFGLPLDPAWIVG